MGLRVSFENKIVGGTQCPRNTCRLFEAGITRGHGDRYLSPGIPVEDVRVELIDGSFHEVDSSEMAFKIAGSMAFKEAAKKAGAVLLEPVMKTSRWSFPRSTWVTSSATSAVVAGHITGMEPRGGRGAGHQSDRAHWPRCSAMPPTVRSMTQGRATYTMQFSHYAEVPSALAQEIIAQQGGRSSTD